MRKLLSIFSFALLYFTVVYGQAVNIPITVSDNTGASAQIYFGLDLTATDELNLALGEDALPGLPPGGYFAAWLFPDFTTLSYKDYRAPGTTPPGSFPYTGHKSFTIRIQTDIPAGNPMTISWDLPPQIVATSTIGNGANTVSFSGTGSHTWNFNPVNLLYIFVEVDFVNIGPVIPAPVFSIAPASLDFGNVFVTASKLLTATVSNPGTDPLVITNITSSDLQFTFAPSTFTVPPAGSQVVTVTFTPTSAGPKTANLTFFHNGPGPSTSYSVQGTGSVTEINPPLIANGGNFGSTGVGTTSSTTVTVQNIDDVPITVGISITEAIVFSAPTSLDIPAHGSSQFTVTFAPTAPGAYINYLTIIPPAGPSVGPFTLSGTAFATSGLIFAQDTVYRLEEDFYMDVMQLKALSGGNLHSMQFRLQTNKEVTDNVILTFQSITKGADISSPNWILETNVVRGPIGANGASQDEIYVLLYHLTGAALPPGDYNDLFHVTYRVAQLQGIQDSIKSTIKITNAEASTIQGFPLNITPNPTPLLTVIALKRGGNYGDVNGDGCVDILDLIMVVDHIVGRDSLTGAEFARADIAPWVPGNATPNPDGIVNVQDLSVIQNIILTGFYPDGTPVGNCGGYIPKFNGDADAVVNIYINNEGITAYLDSKIGIRGAQIEFNNVNGDAGNLVINTDLGQGYYLQTDEILRTLMYDRLAVKYIAEGKHFMADMPFAITNPENITLGKMILVDINTQKVMKIEVNLIYEAAPLPLDYILFQNYPNPFNPSTSVKFQVPKTSDVTIKVYDMLGQEVRTLFTGEVLRGNYTVEWDGLNDAGVQMSSGSYIYRMIAGEFMQAKKMVYVK